MSMCEILEEEGGEMPELELKDKRVNTSKVVRELIALGNADGGMVVIGVREEGNRELTIQNVEEIGQWEESVNQSIVERADPLFDVDFSTDEIDGRTVIAFSVDEFEVLRSFEQDNGKPCIPRRAGTTTSYLGGDEIARHYRDQSVSSEQTSYEEWTDEIRQLADHLIYDCNNTDFSEYSERKDFADEIIDVANQLEASLREPHRELDNDTREKISEVVEECYEVEELSLRAHMAPVTFSAVTDSRDRPYQRRHSRSRSSSSNPSSTSDTDVEYLDDSPDEIEEQVRDKADEIEEAACELRQHLS